MQNSIFNLFRVKPSVVGGFFLVLMIVSFLIITRVDNVSAFVQASAAPALNPAADLPALPGSYLSTIEAQIRDAYLRQEEVVLNDVGTSNVPGLNLSSIDAQISDLHLQEEETVLNAAQMSTFRGFSVTPSPSQ